MSAPSKAYKIELVKIQSGASIASTPELNLASSMVTYCREVKLRGIPGRNASEGIETRNICCSGKCKALAIKKRLFI